MGNSVSNKKGEQEEDKDMVIYKLRSSYWALHGGIQLMNFFNENNLVETTITPEKLIFNFENRMELNIHCEKCSFVITYMCETIVEEGKVKPTKDNVEKVLRNLKEKLQEEFEKYQD